MSHSQTYKTSKIQTRLSRFSNFLKQSSFLPKMGQNFIWFLALSRFRMFGFWTFTVHIHFLSIIMFTFSHDDENISWKKSVFIIGHFPSPFLTYLIGKIIASGSIKTCVGHILDTILSKNTTSLQKDVLKITKNVFSSRGFKIFHSKNITKHFIETTFLKTLTNRHFN